MFRWNFLCEDKRKKEKNQAIGISGKREYWFSWNWKVPLIIIYIILCCSTLHLTMSWVYLYNTWASVSYVTLIFVYYYFFLNMDWRYFKHDYIYINTHWLLCIVYIKIKIANLNTQGIKCWLIIQFNEWKTFLWNYKLFFKFCLYGCVSWFYLIYFFFLPFKLN